MKLQKGWRVERDEPGMVGIAHPDGRCIDCWLDEQVIAIDGGMEIPVTIVRALLWEIDKAQGGRDG